MSSPIKFNIDDEVICIDNGGKFIPYEILNQGAIYVPPVGYKSRIRRRIGFWHYMIDDWYVGTWSAFKTLTSDGEIPICEELLEKI